MFAIAIIYLQKSVWHIDIMKKYRSKSNKPSEMHRIEADIRHREYINTIYNC